MATGVLIASWIKITPFEPDQLLCLCGEVPNVLRSFSSWGKGNTGLLTLIFMPRLEQAGVQTTLPC
jgi:hypothetical protein